MKYKPLNLGGAVMREASLDLTTSSAAASPVALGGGSRRASDSPPMASRRLSAAAHAHVSRTRSGGGAPRPPLSSSTKGKKKSLAKILFPPSMSAAEMVRRGRLGKFVSPKKVSEDLNLDSLFTRPLSLSLCPRQPQMCPIFDSLFSRWCPLFSRKQGQK